MRTSHSPTSRASPRETRLWDSIHCRPPLNAPEPPSPVHSSPLPFPLLLLHNYHPMPYFCNALASFPCVACPHFPGARCSDSLVLCIVVLRRFHCGPGQINPRAWEGKLIPYLPTPCSLMFRRLGQGQSTVLPSLQPTLPGGVPAPARWVSPKFRFCAM